MTPENNSGNVQPHQPKQPNQEQLADQLQRLAASNEQLQAELAEVKKERDAYRQEMLALLPESPFDEAEVEDLLAHPEKYQTLGDFLHELQAEFCNDGK